jgi:hypothetical protein
MQKSTYNPDTLYKVKEKSEVKNNQANQETFAPQPLLKKQKSKKELKAEKAQRKAEEKETILNSLALQLPQAKTELEKLIIILKKTILTEEVLYSHKARKLGTNGYYAKYSPKEYKEIYTKKMSAKKLMDAIDQEYQNNHIFLLEEDNRSSFFRLIQKQKENIRLLYTIIVSVFIFFSHHQLSAE